MANEAYEILALAMRYVFVLLGALVVLRSYRWLLKDHRAHKKEMKRLPDAGLVGEIVAMDTGRAYPLPREGTVGSAHGCDIYLKRDGIRRLHATLRFTDGKGLRVIPHKNADVLVDGEPAEGNVYALHGSVLDLNGCLLRVRLFAGLNVPRLAVYAENPPQEDADEFLPEDEFAPDAQDTWAYAPFPPLDGGFAPDGTPLAPTAPDLNYGPPDDSAPENDASGAERDAHDPFSDPRYDGTPEESGEQGRRDEP